MNHYDKQALKKEAAFFRKFQKYTFYSVKEKRPNVLMRVTGSAIFIRSSKGTSDIRIPRARIRKAIARFLFKRVVTLKDLIKINAYSSAMASILKAIMFDVCKVVTKKDGRIRLTVRGLRYIFSGLSKAKEDLRIVRDNGGRFILLNYFTIRNDAQEKWKRDLLAVGFDYPCVILDPGEKTIYDAQKKGIAVKPIDLDEYAAFIKKHADVIFQYLTLDKIGDAQTTRRNTDYLTNAVGSRPIPIYHIQSSLDELQAIVDEDHDLIAIGGSALRTVSSKRRNEAFQAIFNRFAHENFHALGIGSLQQLTAYDWCSADGSGWLNARIYRSLNTFRGSASVPANMSAEEALGYNIRQLVRLEAYPPEAQYEFDMFCPF